MLIPCFTHVFSYPADILLLFYDFYPEMRTTFRCLTSYTPLGLIVSHVFLVFDVPYSFEEC